MQAATINSEDDPSLDSKNINPSNLNVPTNTPESDEESDVFGDADCGEPFVYQHIILDFTPTEEDTDFIQKKCCDFWDFINKQPELNDLIAEPDLELVSESSEEISVPCKEQIKLTPKLKSKEKTAVSMLEIVEEKGLIDRAFESRLPTSHCNVEFNHYDNEELDDTATTKRKHSEDTRLKAKAKDEHVEPPRPILSIIPSHKTRSQMNKIQDTQAKIVSLPTVRTMCQKLKDWDKEHPKSMKPPGPVPSLTDKFIKLPTVSRCTKECDCKTVCRLSKRSQ